MKNFIMIALSLLSFPSFAQVEKVSECTSAHFQGSTRVPDVEVMSLVQKKKILNLSEVYKKAFRCQNIDCEKKYTLLLVKVYKKDSHYFYELGVLDEVHSHVYKSCLSADLPTVIDPETEGTSSNH